MSEEATPPTPPAEEQKPFVYKPFVYNKRSDEDLRKLALDIIAGKVFGSWNCHSADDVGHVFMIFMFFTKAQLLELQAAKISTFYEYLDKAGPMSVNGLPNFLSINFLDEDDTNRLQTTINTLKAAIAAAPVG